MFPEPSGRPREPLHVLAMAIALALAAFIGGASGLIWQSAGQAESSEGREDEEGEDEK